MKRAHGALLFGSSRQRERRRCVLTTEASNADLANKRPPRMIGRGGLDYGLIKDARRP
jgi:hypothetical protein